MSVDGTDEIPRYGADGEPRFFADPAMDRFAAAFMRLAGELWSQNERIANLVALLEAEGVVDAGRLVAIARLNEDSPAREAELKEFIARVLGPLREPRRR